jgi:patatin-like phospholipase/acyl hydrolase
MAEEVNVKIHPPTAGVGILCIDGGGTRGALPLRMMKRIHDRIGLPIPFQQFFKVAFGISSGTFLHIWLLDLQLTFSRRPHRVSYVCQRMGHRRVC